MTGLFSVFDSILDLAGVVHDRRKELVQALVIAAENEFTERKRSEWRVAKVRVRSEDSPRTGSISNKDLSDTEDQNTNSLSKERPRKNVYTVAFSKFWDAYPRRVQKGDALKAWKLQARSAGGEDELLSRCLVALAWQRAQQSWTKDHGQWIPYPATYLRAASYDDDKPTANGSSGGSQLCYGHRHGYDFVDYTRGCPKCDSARNAARVSP